jgi:anti-anti-sigma factor
MPMSITVEQGPHHTLIHILNDSVDALSAREIEQARGQMRDVTVLDFNRVLFINSAGISALLKLVIEAHKHGQQLYALNVTAHHRKVFEMVDLLRYMPILEEDEYKTKVSGIA